MDIYTYAAILLFFRVVSIALIGIVIKRQLELFKLRIDPEITAYRKRLFYLSITIFVGNLIPALIDVFTLSGELVRSSPTVNTVSLIYTGAWVVTSTLMAYLIHSLYRMSHTVDESHAESEHVLMNDEHTK